MEQKIIETDFLEIDNILETFIRVINGTDMWMGISLTVGGIIITGELVSGHKYFEGLEDVLQDPSSINKVKNESENLFSKMGKEMYVDTKDKDYTIRFIHLRNARFFMNTGNPIPTNGPGMWWRGLLSHIDGYSWGELTYTP